MGGPASGLWINVLGENLLVLADLLIVRLATSSTSEVSPKDPLDYLEVDLPDASFNIHA
jgi:hypothetical protein